jgi:hypothetical protein
MALSAAVPGVVTATISVSQDMHLQMNFLGSELIYTKCAL